MFISYQKLEKQIRVFYTGFAITIVIHFAKNMIITN